MARRIVLACVTLALVVCVQGAGQVIRPVTITTLRGDTIEGVLKSVSETEVLVEIAGQPVRLPLEDVKYMSFVGKLEGGVDAAASATRSTDGVLSAFEELEHASAIGMLREQYNQKLLDALPSVLDFLKSEPNNWFDFRLTVLRAVSFYQAPMKSLEAWSSAPKWMAIAGQYVAYAAYLASLPDEASHREQAEDIAVQLGSEISGRLGFGDTEMPEELDSSTKGAFNDVIKFVLAPQREVVTTQGKTPVVIQMMCEQPCVPHLTLTDASGRKIAAAMGWSGTSTIKRDLATGAYVIWAGAQDGSTRSTTGLGLYKLSVSLNRGQ